MSEQTAGLTSPENVAAGEQVYQQIKAGEITDPDGVAAALDQAYGREG